MEAALENRSCYRDDLQEMLEENRHLIMQVADLQNKGRATECSIVQNHLYKNLLYLGTLANEQMKKEKLQLSPSENHPECQENRTSPGVLTCIPSADVCITSNEALQNGEGQPLEVTSSEEQTPKTPKMVTIQVSPATNPDSDQRVGVALNSQMFNLNLVPSQIPMSIQQPVLNVSASSIFQQNVSANVPQPMVVMQQHQQSVRVMTSTNSVPSTQMIQLQPNPQTQYMATMTPQGFVLMPLPTTPK